MVLSSHFQMMVAVHLPECEPQVLADKLRASQGTFGARPLELHVRSPPDIPPLVAGFTVDVKILGADDLRSRAATATIVRARACSPHCPPVRPPPCAKVRSAERPAEPTTSRFALSHDFHGHTIVRAALVTAPPL